MPTRCFFGLLLLGCCLIACKPSPDGPMPRLDNSWLVPLDQIIDGGPGQDGIPSIDNPQFVQADEVTFLEDDDRVLGFMGPNGPKVYPVKIMDWHEIVNDEVEGVPITIIYCPLTGTGTAWSRVIRDTVTTFGVSGLLYQSNIIPYDRLTESNWSQMSNQSLQGELRGRTPRSYPLLHTTWAQWRGLYPDSKVMSEETGFSRNYNFNPYFDYHTNHLKRPFPVNVEDERLQAKELVFGLVTTFGGPKVNAKAYPLSQFGEDVTVIEETIGPTNVVVAGTNKLVVAFQSRLDGTQLLFSPLQDAYPLVLQDQEGNQYDLYGRAQAGPREGAQLTPVIGYIGYWFAWASFQPGLGLYEG